MTGLIPLVLIITVLGAGVIIVAIDMYIHYQKEVMRNKERMAAIEKGIPLPGNGKTSHYNVVSNYHHSSLRSGIVLLFVGVGLALALWVNAGINGAVWGVFVGLIGVGKLVYWAIAGRKETVNFSNDTDDGMSIK